MTAFAEAVAGNRRAPMPRIVGGRYGLSSKEFTPAMVKAVFDNLASPIAEESLHGRHQRRRDAHQPRRTIRRSSPKATDVVGCIFYGLGADGTVGANKNSIKIIGEETAGYAQGFFVYDSKKSGSRTTSHLRFGPQPIRSTYLRAARAVHRLPPVPVRRPASTCCARPTDGAVFLLNSPFGPDEVWDQLPRRVQEDLIRKAHPLLRHRRRRGRDEAGMAGRINTIMQTCFFAISGVLPRDEAIAQDQGRDRGDLRHAKGRSWSSRTSRPSIARSSNLHEVELPATATSTREPPPIVPRARAAVRAARHGHDDGRPRRRAAGQRDAGRRHLPVRHRAMGEAQHLGHGAGRGSPTSASSAATA